jgi:TfoX/Sxy family transcriptional regulator of competence genes
MTTEREALAERVRALLPHDRLLREVSMFGGLSFMVDDGMVVAAGRDGDLLVRIDPARHDELLQVTGARPAMMGAERPMGPGWIAVSHDGVTTDDQLAFWVRLGMEHRDAPAKIAQAASSRSAG